VADIRSYLENEAFYRIPLTKLATGHYKFEIKINGKKGFFILDTGASTSCIGFKSATKFTLKSEVSEIKAAGAGAINMATEISMSNMVSINKWKRNAVDFVLFDLSHVNQALAQVNEEAVDGIIGADILKQQRAIIDYGRNCLYLK